MPISMAYVVGGSVGSACGAAYRPPPLTGTRALLRREGYNPGEEPPSSRHQAPPTKSSPLPAEARGPSPYDQPPLDPAPPAAPVATPSGFCKRSPAARCRRAVNNAGKWWERSAAALSPLAPQYAPYGRIVAWLGVSLSPPVTEAQIREADRQFHAGLLRALRPVWPTAAVEHARDKTGNHPSLRQFWLLPGGRAAPLALASPPPCFTALTGGSPSPCPLGSWMWCRPPCGRLKARATAPPGPHRRSPAPVSPAPHMVGQPNRGLQLETPLVPPSYEQLFPEYPSPDRAPLYHVHFPAP